MKNAEDGQSVLIIERSLLLEQPEAPEVKRVHVNGRIKKLSKKVDTEGQQYVECQILITAEEGFVFTIEYLLYSRKELETAILNLNKLLAETLLQ